MNFDPDNNIIKLCARGMDFEGQGKNDDALEIYLNAWSDATNDFEKFTAAHYVARQQKTIPDKLQWDKTSLELLLKINDPSMNGALPSLYLNIGKCYEDMHELENARMNYEQALSFTAFLSDDGYGRMIRSGIENGLVRVTTS